MNKVEIRHYISKDRAALRALCTDVADRGLPVENFFPDRDIAADLLTRYYTDYEPQSSFVALVDGCLVGYINGCMDNRRFGLVMAFLILPLIVMKAFKRGLFFHRDVRVLLQGALKNWRRIFVWRKQSFHSHQGHLHIGVAQDLRGQHVGGRLLEALSAWALNKSVEELTASVHEANTTAARFFQGHGFELRARYPMIMVRDGREEHYYSWLYVKTLAKN